MVLPEALGHAEEAEAELIRSPDNLDAWRETLVELILEVQEAFLKQRSEEGRLRAEHSMTPARRAEIAAWRSRKAHYQGRLSVRANEAKRRIAARDGAKRDLGERVAALEAQLDALKAVAR